ncbi:MAG: hypothetical protein ACTHMQ_02465 [Protaetiibacter sp.]
MRIVLGWVGAAVVLACSIVAGVAIANATVFSASGFARDYLTTLADGRVDEVLALPGVDAEGLDRRMLDPLALDTFRWQLVGDTETDGVHRVTVSFHARGMQGRATLLVERVGTRFGLFPEWGFARSPITALSVTTTGDERFTVGRLPLEVADGGPTIFAALTPGVYRFSHRSTFLNADEVTVAALGGEASVEVDIVPSATFLDAAQEAMASALDACARQPVLFPTGCPFGSAIENRVASDPEWTISRMPQARLAPDEHLGTWALIGPDAVAHLRVDVQSLFDGSVSTLERDVPFSAAYRVGFDGSTVVLAPAVDSGD